MPTQRFANLPEEKKERITQAILREFSKHGVDEGDVAGIVKKAGIPRGSFYQYFEDKDDAIFYIVHRIKEDKLAFLSQVMNEAGNMSFIDFYYRAFFRSLEFADKNPEYVSIGAYIVTSKNKKIQEYIKAASESFYPYYEALIEKDKANGIIKKDIDNQSVILLITNTTSDVAVKLVYERHVEFNDVKKNF